MAKPRPKKASTADTTYQLKVNLLGTDPPIWRRIEIPASSNLTTLHTTIQLSFGWFDSHLHEFKIGSSAYGEPDPGSGPLGRTVRNEGNARLGNVVQPGARFTYTYDFGDSWEHEIVVEKSVDAQPGVGYPRCTAGERACPPEDCGGVWGYENFLEAIADPNHSDHEDMSEWFDGTFDPELFDLTDTNKAIEYRLGRGR